MRLISTAALVLAATMVAGTEAHAQMSINVAVGAAMPIGDVADVLDMGYNATIGVGIKPPLAPVGVRIEGMFNSFEYKENLIGLESHRVLALTANGTLSGPAMPGYLIAGIGMYNGKSTVSGGSTDGETDFGFNIGGGLNLPLTGFSTYLEVRYHHVPGDGGAFKFVPITVGLRF